MLNNLIDPYARLVFYCESVTNTTKELRHGRPTLVLVLESPLVVLIVGKVLTCSRLSLNCECVTLSQSNRCSRGKRRTSGLILVHDTRRRLHNNSCSIEVRLLWRNKNCTTRSPLDDQGRTNLRQSTRNTSLVQILVLVVVDVKVVEEVDFPALIGTNRVILQVYDNTEKIIFAFHDFNCNDV